MAAPVKSASKTFMMPMRNTIAPAALPISLNAAHNRYYRDTQRIQLIELAQAITPQVRGIVSGHVERADAHDLPFADDAFDVVTCANTFHYFTHPTQVLREARRVLRPGGRLVLLDWCRDFWTCRGMDAVLHWIDPAYQTCYTLGEMRALVEATPLRTRYDFRYRFDGVWGMMIIEAVRPQSA